MNLIKSVFSTALASLAVLLTGISSATAGALVAAPEPSTLALVAIGVVGVIAAARMRK